ncbi:MAG: hypothetical protein OXB93_00565 [Cytophagales bacterium]|nr:hypothetical protein [Cytophagales bacterium]
MRFWLSVSLCALLLSGEVYAQANPSVSLSLSRGGTAVTEINMERSHRVSIHLNNVSTDVIQISSISFAPDDGFFQITEGGRGVSSYPRNIPIRSGIQVFLELKNPLKGSKTSTLSVTGSTGGVLNVSVKAEVFPALKIDLLKPEEGVQNLIEPGTASKTIQISFDHPFKGVAETLFLRVINVGSWPLSFTGNPIVGALSGNDAAKFSVDKDEFTRGRMEVGEVRLLSISHKSATSVDSSSPDEASLAASFAAPVGPLSSAGTPSAVSYPIDLTAVVGNSSAPLQIWASNQPSGTDRPLSLVNLGWEISQSLYLKNVDLDPIQVSNLELLGLSRRDFLISSTNTPENPLSSLVGEIDPGSFSSAIYVVYRKGAISEGKKLVYLSVSTGGGESLKLPLSADRSPQLKIEIIDDLDDVRTVTSFPHDIHYDAYLEVAEIKRYRLRNEGSHPVEFSSIPFTGLEGEVDVVRKYVMGPFSSDPLLAGEERELLVTYSPGTDEIERSASERVKFDLSVVNVEPQLRTFRLEGTARTPRPPNIEIRDSAGNRLEPVDEENEGGHFEIPSTTIFTPKKFELILKNAGEEVLNISRIDFRPISVELEESSQLFKVLLPIPPTVFAPLSILAGKEKRIPLQFAGGREATEQRTYLLFASNSVDNRFFRLNVHTTPRPASYKVFLEKEDPSEDEIPLDEILLDETLFSEKFEEILFSGKIDFVSEGIALSGEKRAKQRILLRNLSLKPITLSSVSLSGEEEKSYSLEGVSLGEIAAESWIAFYVYYTPLVERKLSSALLDIRMSEGLPEQYELRLSGTVSYALASLRDRDAELIGGSSKNRSQLNAYTSFPSIFPIQVENLGNAPLEIKTIDEVKPINWSGTHASRYTLVEEENLPIIVPPKDHVFVHVKVSPEESDGGADLIAKLTLHSNSNTGDYIVDFSTRVSSADYSLKAEDDEIIPLRGEIPFLPASELRPEVDDRVSNVYVLRASSTDVVLASLRFSPSGFYSTDLEIPSDGLRIPAGEEKEIRVYHAPTSAAEKQATLSVLVPGAVPPRYEFDLKGEVNVPSLTIKIGDLILEDSDKLEDKYLVGDVDSYLCEVSNQGVRPLLISDIRITNALGTGIPGGFELAEESYEENPVALPSRTSQWKLDPEESKKFLLNFDTRAFGVKLSVEDPNLGVLSLTSNHNGEVDVDRANRPNHNYRVNFSLVVHDVPNLAILYQEKRLEQDDEGRIKFPFVAEAYSSSTHIFSLLNLSSRPLSIQGIGFGNEYRIRFNGFVVEELAGVSGIPSPGDLSSAWFEEGTVGKSSLDISARKFSVTYIPSLDKEGESESSLQVLSDTGGEEFPERNLLIIDFIPDVITPSFVLQIGETSKVLESGASQELHSETSKKEVSSYTISNQGKSPVVVTEILVEEDALGAYSLEGFSLPFTLDIGQNKTFLLNSFLGFSRLNYKSKLVIISNAEIYSLNLSLDVVDPIIPPYGISSNKFHPENKRLVISPNPSRGLSHIYYFPSQEDHGTPKKNHVYNIYSLDGNKIDTDILPPEGKTIPVSTYPEGVYIISVNGESIRLIVN